MTVAQLVGYQNVLDAVVDERGDVRVGRALPCCAAVRPLPGRPSSRPGPAGCSSARTPRRRPFRVTEVGPGPGHWRVELRGAAPLTAHVPWERPPPAVGDEVTVTVRPSAAALVRRPSCAG